MSSFLDGWLKKRNRIVIFAGVFDPVHIGHISAAREALWYGSKIVFMPERVPQHKHGTADYKHRMKMLEIALKNEKDMMVVDYPDDHQYIKPTFEWLQSVFPDNSFMWLVGSDVLEHIQSWPDSDKLLELRVEGIVTLPRSDDAYVTYRPKTIHETPVHYLYRLMRKKSHQAINSTAIRHNMSSKHTALPAGVYEYIKQHDLYN